MARWMSDVRSGNSATRTRLEAERGLVADLGRGQVTVVASLQHVSKHEESISGAPDKAA